MDSSAIEVTPEVVEEETQKQTRECPYCAEIIAQKAKKCKHCGEFLDEALRLQGQTPINNSQPNQPQVTVMQGDNGNRDMLYFSNKKSGFLAAFLNLILPGVGYMYCQ